ncbi:MAG: ATP-binding protein [Nitrosopumilales archaeon]|nr:MAG: ATP-binding protein [Nitrosopumilales archaeon]
MKLTKIVYVELEGTPYEWRLEESTFDEINLIVGKNAIGKSRTISIINGLAAILSRVKKISWLSGNYQVEFDNMGKLIRYELEYKDRVVTHEKLVVNGDTKLIRGKDGTGYIRAEELDIDGMKFQIPTDEVAAYSRRDMIQHPFLEALNKWGSSNYLFYFGTDLGKSRLGLPFGESMVGLKSSLYLPKNNPDVIVYVLLHGLDKYGTRYAKTIIKDMRQIGYDIDMVGVETPSNLIIEDGPIPIGIFVKERDLPSNTNQTQMYQGMFRALSVFIQINFAILDSKPSCFMIDDIGEGLDFARSSSLIKCLIQKSKKHKIQLIMTTNDRFVMNAVPLEYWIILHRSGCRVRSFNDRNSHDMFEQFRYTGLNNFDLFTSNFFLKDNNNND